MFYRKWQKKKKVTGALLVLPTPGAALKHGGYVSWEILFPGRNFSVSGCVAAGAQWLLAGIFFWTSRECPKLSFALGAYIALSVLGVVQLCWSSGELAMLLFIGFVKYPSCKTSFGVSSLSPFYGPLCPLQMGFCVILAYSRVTSVGWAWICLQTPLLVWP